MVFFALTKAGFDEVETFIRNTECAVWINAGVLTELEQSAMRQEGVELTAFFDRIDSSNQVAIDEAVVTIAQHHPGERVWMERGFDLL